MVLIINRLLSRITLPVSEEILSQTLCHMDWILQFS